MKKIFTLLLMCVTALAGSAAKFQLYFGDTPASDGDKFTTYYTVTTQEKNGKVYKSYLQDSNLFIDGAAGTPVTVTVKSNNTTVQFCSIDGECVVLGTSNGYSVTKSGTLTGQKFSLEIDRKVTKQGDADPKLQNIIVDVTVTSGSETATVQVDMTTEPASALDIVGADKVDSVRLVGRTLNYQTSHPAALEIYSILGSKVLAEGVNGSGSLSVADLPRGLYVYRLGSVSGKILVK